MSDTVIRGTLGQIKAHCNFINAEDSRGCSRRVPAGGMDADVELLDLSFEGGMMSNLMGRVVELRVYEPPPRCESFEKGWL
jgi:hypothetical protein